MRAAIRELRLTLVDVNTTTGSEPSPLFWTILSARVRSATARLEPQRAPWWRGAWQPIAATACVVVAILLTQILPRGRIGTVNSPDAAVPAAAITTGIPDSLVVSDEGSLNFVASVASMVSPDELQQAAGPSSDATDAMFDQLTQEQRAGAGALADDPHERRRVKSFTMALVVAFAAVVVPAYSAAQSPADGSQPGTRLDWRTGGRGAAPETVTPQQIQTLFDGMVLSRAQVALQLTDQQFAVFIPKLLNYQKLQQRHRQQRQGALAELRRLAGPNAPEGTEDAFIAEKAKALDDLEVQAVQDQQRAMADLIRCSRLASEHDSGSSSRTWNARKFCCWFARNRGGARRGHPQPSKPPAGAPARSTPPVNIRHPPWRRHDPP